MISGNNIFHTILLLLFVVFLCTGCDEPLFKNWKFPYKIGKPEREYALEKRIAEVSGITLLPGNEAALVEDETGAVFFFSLDSGKIIREVIFGENGDYEDVELVGDKLYVLRADGTLVEIPFENDSLIVSRKRVYDSWLGVDNDTEGLCYDEKNNRLLIACKGDPAKKTDNIRYKNMRAMYAFDLSKKVLSQTPVLIINENKVDKEAHMQKRNIIQKMMRLYRLMDPELFMPSGVAIHPISGETYIISSVGNLLVVLGTDNRIKFTINLPSKDFKQPEGIAFDSNGDMYISNEGRKGKANILKFSYITKREGLFSQAN